jgi:phosphoglycerate dehydrogenase-like enzyme
MLGYGDIGQSIRAVLHTMGATVQPVARRQRTAPAGETMFGIDRLDALLPETEAIIMALPANPATRHVIDARRLGLMRPDALLVNVGRGEAIDETTLARSLRRGGSLGRRWTYWMRSCCPDLITTPHIAGFGDGPVNERLAERVVSSALKLSRGDEREGRVLPPRHQSAPEIAGLISWRTASTIPNDGNFSGIRRNLRRNHVVAPIGAHPIA